CRHEVTTEGIEKARKIVSFLMPYNPLRHAFGVPPPLIKGRLSKVFRQTVPSASEADGIFLF
ncbi:MAG: hypothetical protein IJ496_03055, partial [Ruminococcus sp.]|nr:hypothetical protein [Ruminococcus sp.]